MTPAATFSLLPLGTVAVTTALVLTLTRAEDSGAAAAAAPTPSAHVPRVGAPTGGGPVGTLADPAWVARAAAATDIAERALAAYAGASLAANASHPGCGLGWNTLAAIGLVESEDSDRKGASARQLVDTALSTALVLCATEGDLTRPDDWIAAVTAHDDDPDFVARVAEVATAYGAAVETL
jgi:hypothetical protein